jgi:hypothetical protein
MACSSHFPLWCRKTVMFQIFSTAPVLFGWSIYSLSYNSWRIGYYCPMKQSCGRMFAHMFAVAEFGHCHYDMGRHTRLKWNMDNTWREDKHNLIAKAFPPKIYCASLFKTHLTSHLIWLKHFFLLTTKPVFMWNKCLHYGMHYAAWKFTVSCI